MVRAYIYSCYESRNIYDKIRYRDDPLFAESHDVVIQCYCWRNGDVF